MTIPQRRKDIVDSTINLAERVRKLEIMTMTSAPASGGGTDPLPPENVSAAVNTPTVSYGAGQQPTILRVSPYLIAMDGVITVPGGITGAGSIAHNTILMDFTDATLWPEEIRSIPVTAIADSAGTTMVGTLLIAANGIVRWYGNTAVKGVHLDGVAYRVAAAY
jgi:hypothetical protein